MSKYLELVEISEGIIVLRRSDAKDSPLVKIEFSGDVKSLLNGMEFDVAKEMIKALIISFATSNSIPFKRDLTSPENSIFTNGESFASDLLKTIMPSEISTSSKYLDILLY